MESMKELTFTKQAKDEMRAINKIKTNPKFFFSYAKKRSKTNKTQPNFLTLTVIWQLTKNLLLTFFKNNQNLLATLSTLTLFFHQLPPQTALCQTSHLLVKTLLKQLMKCMPHLPLLISQSQLQYSKNASIPLPNRSILCGRNH